MLRRLSEANSGPLPDKVVMHLFTEVISACRALEDALSVAFLGPRGTFSEEAVIKHFGGQVPVMLCTSIDEVFRAVEAGNAGYGVVPVENSTEGAVGRTLDLLLATPLRICGEVLLPVHQNLLSNGSDIAAIKIHLFACAEPGAVPRWLTQNCPGAERVPVVSNAEAARMAQAKAGCAAIAGRAGRRPLWAVDCRGQHRGRTEQHDALRRDLGTGRAALGSGQDLAGDVHAKRAGRHARVADAVRRPIGVSMTRLESRPSRTGLWEYVFFLDIEGHQNDAHVARALEEMRDLAAFLKILGSYPVAVQ